MEGILPSPSPEFDVQESRSMISIDRTYENYRAHNARIRNVVLNIA
jgi:hypothetical protein